MEVGKEVPSGGVAAVLSTVAWGWGLCGRGGGFALDRPRRGARGRGGSAGPRPCPRASQAIRDPPRSLPERPATGDQAWAPTGASRAGRGGRRPRDRRPSDLGKTDRGPRCGRTASDRERRRGKDPRRGGGEWVRRIEGRETCEGALSLSMSEV